MKIKRGCIVYTPLVAYKTIFVNEPGMYNLVLKSRKPKANGFMLLLTHEIILSIKEKRFVKK